MKKTIQHADLFIPQTNGTISDSLLKSWTRQAYECYRIKCDCTKCSINKKEYSFVCQMPKVVKELLRSKIKPDLALFEVGTT